MMMLSPFFVRRAVRAVAASVLKLTDQVSELDTALGELDDKVSERASQDDFNDLDGKVDDLERRLDDANVDDFERDLDRLRDRVRDVEDTTELTERFQGIDAATEALLQRIQSLERSLYGAPKDQPITIITPATLQEERAR